MFETAPVSGSCQTNHRSAPQMSPIAATIDRPAAPLAAALEPGVGHSAATRCDPQPEAGETVLGRVYARLAAQLLLERGLGGRETIDHSFR
jgi:hypothetical protein